MDKSKGGQYESSNYRQWVTLPPQIPIPYNEDFLHLLSLQFSNLTYLNTPFIPQRIGPNKVIDKDNSLRIKSRADLKVNTFWWGQHHGYQSLIKTLVQNNQRTQSHRVVLENQLLIKSNSKQYNNLPFQPVQFLICTPLQNFLKYCFDMKILKIELLSAETNIMIAKTYLNFLTLSNSWKGEPAHLNLPLFVPNESGKSFSNNPKSAKIIGQISLDIKIEKIKNPYKMVPQSLSKLQIMKENDPIFENRQINIQRREQEIKIVKRENSSQNVSQVQKYELSRQSQESFPQRDEILTSSRKESQSKQDQVPEIKMKKSSKPRSILAPKPLSIEPSRPVSIENIVPGYQRLTVPKHNFESEKIQLNEDIKIIFGVKNTLYQQIFNQQSISHSKITHQTIQFKIKLIETLSSHQQLTFQNIQISIPIPQSYSQSQNKNYKINQYILSQKEGVITLQLQTSTLSLNQIQSFIKSALLQVQIKYSSSFQKKQDQVKIKGRMKPVTQYQIERFTVLRGSLSLLTVLSKNGLPNRVNLSLFGKRSQNICELYITGLPKQTKIQSIPQEKIDSKTSQQLNTDKSTKQQNRVQNNEYGWLKVEKFIPINSNYLKDANIFVRICLIKKSLNSQQQNRKIQLFEIAQTDTLWKAFGDKKQVAEFENQIITFCNQSSFQNEMFMKLEIVNRQHKNIKIGECLFPLKTQNKTQTRGRMQLQVKNTKMETLGHLQCWLEQGDTNYINKLIVTHLHHPKDKNHSKHYSKQQIVKVVDIKKQTKPQNSQHYQQNISQSSSSSYSLANLSHTSQNNPIDTSHQQHSQIKQIDPHLDQFQSQLNKQYDILKIHNHLFLRIIVAINTQQISKNYLQNIIIKYNLSIDKNPFIDFYQFCDFISGIISSPNESQQIRQKRSEIIAQKSDEINDYWVKKLFTIYLDKTKVGQEKKLMNFLQFSESFQGFTTFYDQIIEEKDQVFREFLEILDWGSIEINDLQEILQNGINRRDRTDLIRIWRDTIVGHMMKLRKLNNDSRIKYESVLQRLFMFYSQRMGLLQVKSKLHKKETSFIEKMNVVSVICSQLRRFELYETSYGSEIESQYFKCYISKSIRELLEIDYYLPLGQLIKIVEENQIELSKWEMLNLFTEMNTTKADIKQCQQKQYYNEQHSQKAGNVKLNGKQSVNNHKQKVILKSPTFGVLQHLKVLNLCEFQDERKRTDKSEILMKKTQLISPINRTNENREVASLSNPSIFSNNQNNTNLVNEQGHYSNTSNLTRNYASYKLKSTYEQRLMITFYNLKCKISSVQVGKNTYFVDQKSKVDKKLTHVANRSNTEQNIQVCQKSIENSNITQQFNNDKFQQSQFTSLTPIVIPLSGLIPKDQYNLVIAVQRYKDKVQSHQYTGSKQREDIFINCEHGVEQMLIDQSGVQIGSLIVCLVTEIQSFSNANMM